MTEQHPHFHEHGGSRHAHVHDHTKRAKEQVIRGSWYELSRYSQGIDYHPHSNLTDVPAHKP